VTVRVAIADDQALVRGGFRMILDAKEDMEVVGEAEDGAAAVDLVERVQPDVVLMDVRMPGMDGIEATRRIVAAGGPARIIILTTYDVDEHVFAALRAGPSAFLLKDARPGDLVEAIRVVARGDALLAPSVTRRLLDRFAGDLPAPAGESPPAPAPHLDELTDREAEVLRFVALALSNAEIAARLHLTEATVKTHVSSVLRKLGLRDRVDRRARLRRRARAAALILKSQARSIPAPDAGPALGADHRAMTEDHRDERRAGVQRAAGTVLLIALVSLTLHFATLPSVDPPSISLPDLPGWVGPLFRWIRWAVISVVVVLVVIGAVEDREKERS
jgi:DNA-binding NarL/FixJ family response regulator